jgi:hypothetical protein
MAKHAISVGALLIVLAVAFFVLTGASHYTALIPGGIGFPILICGLIARDESKRKHAMHGAVVFGVLGVLGSASRAFKLPALLNGAQDDPLPVYESAVMFILCLVFVILCVNSFISVRRSQS